MFTAIVTK